MMAAMAPISAVTSTITMMTRTWAGVPLLFPGTALTVGGEGVAVAGVATVGVGVGAAVGCGEGAGVDVKNQVIFGSGIGVGVFSGVWPYPIAGGKIGVTPPLSSVPIVTTGSTTVMWNLSDALSPLESVTM